MEKLFRVQSVESWSSSICYRYAIDEVKFECIEFDKLIDYNIHQLDSLCTVRVQQGSCLGEYSMVATYRRDALVKDK